MRLFQGRRAKFRGPGPGAARPRPRGAGVRARKRGYIHMRELLSNTALTWPQVSVVGAASSLPGLLHAPHRKLSTERSWRSNVVGGSARWERARILVRPSAALSHKSQHVLATLIERRTVRQRFHARVTEERVTLPLLQP